MRKARVLALTILSLGLSSGATRAFAPELFRDTSSGRWYPVRWGPSTVTVPIRLSDRPLSLLPNIDADSESYMAAVEGAIRAWSASPVNLRLAGTTPTTEWRQDGINLVTFANTTRNREVTTNAPNTSLRWWTLTGNPRYWRISEVDIISNPRERFATDGQAFALDVQGSLTLQFGHAIGLSHSAIASSVMWPYVIGGDRHARYLDPDDLAAVEAAYNTPLDSHRGAVQGRVVTPTDTPVFGAHVVATDSAGIVRTGAFTDKDGSFAFPWLPIGSYTFHVEPLNRELFTGQFSYDYYRGAKRDFLPTFIGGGAPQTVAVAEGAQVVLDPVRVEARRPTLHVQHLGSSPSGNWFVDIGPRPATLAAGESAVLFLAGTGLSADVSVRVSGGDVTVHSGQRRAVPRYRGLPALLVTIAARAGASPGGRNLIITQNGEVTFYSGGIKIIAP